MTPSLPQQPFQDDNEAAISPFKKQKKEVMGADNRNTSNDQDQRQQKKRLQKLSHTLSWVLRHAAHTLKLPMTADGYVPVEVLLQHSHPRIKGHSWTLHDVIQVVETNDKQRFHLAPRPASNYPPLTAKNKQDSTTTTTSVAATDSDDNVTILCIRANQGHTISSIDPNLLLTRLSPEELVALPMIVHGTYMAPWLESICKNGLSRMKRNHIHFATGLSTSSRDDDGTGKDGVISGMRKSCDVYIYIDKDKCSRDETIIFFQSANGVILSAGVNDQGMLPTSFFSHVTDKDGTILLDNRESTKEF